MTKLFAIGCLLLLILCSVLFTETLAWDSAGGNPTHPTHTYLTEYAINQLKGKFPEVDQYREALIEGANTELHELPLTPGDYSSNVGHKYGLNLELMRNQHGGTNAGCGNIEGWWVDAFRAYHTTGQRKQAYFLLGIMLHMVEDMGVPAHANNVYHQAPSRNEVLKFDNFEAISALNWEPSFGDINRKDPLYNTARNLPQPWLYYKFSESWTQSDARNFFGAGGYTLGDRDNFPKFWKSASDQQKALVSNRQGRTCKVTEWALKSAMNAFADRVNQ